MRVCVSEEEGRGWEVREREGRLSVGMRGRRSLRMMGDKKESGDCQWA